MGILNTTPDSFSDGGRFDHLEAALEQAQALIAEGASILDVGGESTRPGAKPVSEEEEIRRTLPVIKALRAEWAGLISIDTSKAEVAQQALAAGADIVNDVSGLEADPRMIEVCQKAACGLVVMHRQGLPESMQDCPSYQNVVAEVRRYFLERYEMLQKAGIDPEAIVFDPGIGFGKAHDHNLALLSGLEELQIDDRPLLLGVSRKSVIGRCLGEKDLSLRDWPTVAMTAYAAAKGVPLHRVHAVRHNLEALRMVEAIQGV